MLKIYSHENKKKALKHNENEALSIIIIIMPFYFYGEVPLLYISKITVYDLFIVIYAGEYWY